MKQILAVFGGLFGLLLLLAAIFNWKIIPVPSQRPSVGSPAGALSPGTRLAVAIIGIIFIVLAILTLSGNI
jgi:predicted small integral membrane protein